MKKTLLLWPGSALCLWAFSQVPVPAAAVPRETFPRLPVREVTVFKDGHAFVAHEGEMPTDAKGDVVMDYLPTPVIGTFWPYSVNNKPKLKGVTAAQERVQIPRTALNLRELLEANLGAEAIITEHGTNRYEATILGLPERSGRELAETSPPNAPERLPEKGSLVLLKSAEGTRALPIERIQEVIFKGDHNPRVTTEEFRNLLRLTLDWGASQPAPAANIGLIYLQKGIRWVPSYKVNIDGLGKASVILQATLINELTDLEDVAVNLVVGVPSFAFKDTLDPIALQQTLANLSQHFQPASPGFRHSPIASQFSNAIMSQSAAPGAYAAVAVDAGDLGAGVSEAERNEDLFLFTLPHISLRRGERMIVTIAEFSTGYTDIFALDVPILPPRELQSNLGADQQRELSRLLNSPKVMHKIRLANESKYPLTTAPALILRQDKVLAQALMTYTSPGSKVDLPVTAAIEFQVKTTEREKGRKAGALAVNSEHYTRIDLAGDIKITSFRKNPTEIEVTRHGFGIADEADAGGKFEQATAYDYDTRFEYPYWWSWFGWPWWSHHHNGIARFTWTVALEPGKTAELNYQWHYFWR